jgi:peptide/nickel transport system substrate-binding protein
MIGRPSRALGALPFLFAVTLTASAADPAKILRVGSVDIETLDPQAYNDDPSYQVQTSIFEGLYEWDYLASPTTLVPNTAAALRSRAS